MQKERNHQTAGEVSRQVIARACRVKGLGSEDWRLIGALNSFLSEYGITEDVISDRQLRGVSGLHGKSYERSRAKLVQHRLFERTVTGGGRGSDTTWRYIPDDEVDPPETTAQTTAGMTAGMTAPVAVIRSPKTEARKGLDVGTQGAPEERQEDDPDTESGLVDLAVLNDGGSPDPSSMPEEVPGVPDREPDHRRPAWLVEIRKTAERTRSGVGDGTPGL